MKNLKVISIHKVQYLSETNVRKFRGQKCMMLQHTWEKLKKHLPYLDTYYSFSYNDTMVMDNVYPSLHAIFSNHIFFYPDPKNARCITISKIDGIKMPATLTGHRRGN